MESIALLAFRLTTWGYGTQQANPLMAACQAGNPSVSTRK
jgi:hypothetical protein